MIAAICNISICFILCLVFSRGLDCKESACGTWDPGLNPGSGRFTWKRKRQPTLVFLPGKSHGQKSLVGCRPSDRKESDTTKWLNTFTLLIEHYELGNVIGIYFSHLWTLVKASFCFKMCKISIKKKMPRFRVNDWVFSSIHAAGSST